MFLVFIVSSLGSCCFEMVLHGVGIVSERKQHTLALGSRSRNAVCTIRAQRWHYRMSVRHTPLKTTAGFNGLAKVQTPIDKI